MYESVQKKKELTMGITNRNIYKQGVYEPDVMENERRIISENNLCFYMSSSGICNNKNCDKYNYKCTVKIGNPCLHRHDNSCMNKKDAKKEYVQKIVTSHSIELRTIASTLVSTRFQNELLYEDSSSQKLLYIQDKIYNLLYTETQLYNELINNSNEYSFEAQQLSNSIDTINVIISVISQLDEVNNATYHSFLKKLQSIATIINETY